MLTEAEKQHIELQEKYRAEIASKLKSPAKINLVETITKILQGLAIIVGIGATYHEFKKYNDEKIGKLAEETRQANRDFSKIFYQQQLATYAEAVEAVAILANENEQTEDYKTARKKFERLYWGRLSLVEDKRVEARMVQFRLLLLNFEGIETTKDRVWDAVDSVWIPLRNVTQSALQTASINLAHDARVHTLKTWLSPEEKVNYNDLD
ncbi:hypothetical protein [Paraflavitalea sp. CAU 1676]|uniref:hypothetical protein n=1 Tax=Paraflavitalea sp. CAU 1676 TaxID=3032598 RepID=UPI0023DAD70D|nr:hypothetical protein [Paraflavitalea sp. CAU 1676]MDF2189735.1 hypothetical protein [Paraflavitalea sp. CAU 1676]